MRYGLKWPEYAKQWDRMVIKPSRAAEFDGYAKQLIKNKARYQAIERTTGVPWFLIAVLHLRESGADFSKSLAQGDPWNRRSRNKPISGPFGSFEESAVWALRHDSLASIVDWRLEKVLYNCEIFNGAGYDMRGIPSPYVWGGTNIQKPGKYIRDNVWSSTTWDIQPGTAPIIKRMGELDDTIMKIPRED